ncbi:hypothetical protein FA15DRAFT_735778 [Coprinopsis marcescibilis]|uniref:Uncharacterized protein n=1 Tax=Coprinopsis marcescibilis TaxID=230819 RepID=A0A5C3KBS9_COPMA|nr:hypothetical protein FA15DRAFT_735778 [Coprinopsis marcescibilis]
MALGDMLGSAKMNGMSGHSAIYGDRFTKVQGARSSTQTGAKAQYYPTGPPENETYNPTCPATYDLTNLPHRSQTDYWIMLCKIDTATSKRQIAAISRDTGVARIPLCVASPAFLHPSYFPIDPFHLFYENCMPFVWDTWTTGSKPRERVHIPADKIEALGALVGVAYKTLPPVFCGTIRNPHLKRQSQYKAYKWMALLHWYILPMGLELEFDFSVLNNFSYFVEAVQTAMMIKSHSQNDLKALQGIINTFLETYEALYVGNDPTKILRCCLCVFQLVHVPIHISWYGSIRNGSQATVEREIGHAEHQIHLKTHPFANLENIIVENEMVRLVQLYHPTLSPLWAKDRTFASPLPSRLWKLSQALRINKVDVAGLADHFAAIRQCLGIRSSRSLMEYDLRRFGKLQMTKHTLRSRISEIQTSTTNKRAEISTHQFAEAIAFYSLSYLGQERTVAVYTPLEGVNSPLKTVIRGKWPSDATKIFAIETASVSNLVGIWEAKDSGNVYVLRKHPGLEMLDTSQCGLPHGLEKEADDGETDDS